jgi:hypothetical protein
MSEIYDFAATVKKLQDTLNSNSAYSPFIEFKVGNFVISTLRPEYIMSLQNVRNGSGYANTFTLSIAYTPLASCLGSYTDADKIDKLLNSEDGNPTCTLRYGYKYPIELSSPTYSGRILDYTVDMRNGIIFYTITGYSSITDYKEVKPTISPTDISSSSSERPTNIVKIAFNKYLASSGYKFEFGANTENTDNQIEIQSSSGVSIFQYFNTVLGQAVYSGDSSDTKDSERSIYTFRIDDINKKFIVYRISVSANIDKNVKFVFNWLSRDADLVISFQTEFKGAVLLAQKINTSYTNNNNTRYGIDQKGDNITADMKTHQKASGSSSSSDSAESRKTWAQATLTSYKATLTTLGIPAQIDISTVVKVVPLVYGKAHHTQGNYMITSITDNIDTSGFNTTLEMFKLPT